MKMAFYRSHPFSIRYMRYLNLIAVLCIPTPQLVKELYPFCDTDQCHQWDMYVTKGI
ncbi:MAG: hypothetical protein HQK52_08130 [Oligoflexia bacterium]|nr:hypothetical protein [Oligoflexia bacterium]